VKLSKEIVKEIEEYLTFIYIPNFPYLFKLNGIVLGELTNRWKYKSGYTEFNGEKFIGLFSPDAQKDLGKKFIEVKNWLKHIKTRNKVVL